jgi:hypothetical protein
VSGDEITITFKATEAFSQRLAKDACDLDISKSLLIRACILLASPIIKDKPFLLSVLERTCTSKKSQ